MDQPRPSTAEQTTYDPPAFFGQVYAEECEAVRARRQRSDSPAGPGPLTDLRGVALSGGGIRSATFCLGVLQQLAAEGRLRCVDYLSTVSGGGFIGGWWSAWLARPPQPDLPAGPSAIFPLAEGIELDRQGGAADYTPEGSRSAGHDPIHHVRLFANYLTPRKGALSADTWRAITVIARNLAITLLTLLPILGAGVFLAQLYFVADSNLAAPFACGRVATRPNSERAAAAGLAPPAASDTAVPGPGARGRAPTRFCSLFDTLPATDLDRHLQVRFARALVPVVILLAWLTLATLFWALAGTGDLKLAAVAVVAVVIMLGLAARGLTLESGGAIVQEMRKDRWLGWTLLAGAVLITLWAAWLAVTRLWRDRKTARSNLSAAQGEVLTNRLTRLQTVLLASLAAVTAMVTPLIREGLDAWLRKAGGWGAVLLALAGSVFTAFKAGPTGGGDTSGSGEPGRLTSIAFAVTPPLVILVLLVALGTGSHALLGTLTASPAGTMSSLHRALIVAVTICAAFACYEFLAGERSGWWRRFGVAIGALVLGYIAYRLPPRGRLFATTVAGVGLGLVISVWLWREVLPRARRRVEVRLGRELPQGGWAQPLLLLAIPPALGGVGFGLGHITGSVGPVNAAVARPMFAGMMFAAAFLVLMALLSRRSNQRAMWLLSLVYVLLGATYIEQFLKPELAQVFFFQGIVAFIGVALAAVVAG